MTLVLIFVSLSLLDGVNAFFQNLFNAVMWWIITFGPIGIFFAMILQVIIAVIPSEMVLMLGGATFSIQYSFYSYVPLIFLFPDTFNILTSIFYIPFIPLYGLNYGIVLAGFVGGTGEVVGGAIGFYIARFVGRPVIERWKQETMERVDTPRD